MDGVARDVSPACGEILGRRPEEVIGRKFLDFVSAVDREFIRQTVQKAKVNTHAEFEVGVAHLNGTARLVSWMTSREGGPIYAYGRDITICSKSSNPPARVPGKKLVLTAPALATEIEFSRMDAQRYPASCLFQRAAGRGGLRRNLQDLGLAC